jgi:hypothetical protein
MSELLHFVISSCADIKSKTFVLIDKGFAELFKWSSSESLYETNLQIVEISIEPYALSMISRYKPEKLIFFISGNIFVEINTMKCLIETANSLESIVFTSTSAEVLSLNENKSMDTYSLLIDKLSPSKASIYYFPFHLINLLPSNFENDVSLIYVYQ